MSKHIKTTLILVSALGAFSVLGGFASITSTHSTNTILQAGRKNTNKTVEYAAIPSNPSQYHKLRNPVIYSWKHATPVPVENGFFTFQTYTFYGFKSENSVVTGLAKINNKIYSFGVNGVMKTGWEIIDGKTYYFSPNGGAAAIGTTVINGKIYHFNSEGELDRQVDGSYTTNDSRVNNKLGFLVGANGKTYYILKNEYMGVLNQRPTWKLTYVTGFQRIDGDSYLFNSSGQMQTGWYTDTKTGNRYYFNPDNDGAAVTGWFDRSGITGAPLYFNQNGELQTGLQKIDGKYYYFAPKTGNWQNGNGERQTGWKVINGQKYYFNPEANGAAVTGWFDKSGITGAPLYFNQNGQMQTGLQKIDGKYYYLTPNIGGNWQTHSGERQTGWKTINGQRYYFSPEANGAAVTGWFYRSGITGAPHYFNQNGQMQTGLQKIDGNYYYLSPKTGNWENGNGERQTGWKIINGNEYYFNPEDNGAAVTGWFYRSGITGAPLYFNQNGQMQTGLQKIDGKYYYLTPNIGGNWQTHSGERQTGWKTINGQRYYFNPKDNGAAATGTQVIDGHTYTFSSTGVLQNN